MVYGKVKIIYKKYIFLIIIFLSVGFFYFREYCNVYSHLIAVSWGDGPYGKAMYGVYVYKGAEKDGRVQIKLRVYISRDDYYFIPYYKDFGVIGVAGSDKMFDEWGTVLWQPEGVFIGNAPERYFISKEVLGEHR